MKKILTIFNPVFIYKKPKLLLYVALTVGACTWLCLAYAALSFFQEYQETAEIWMMSTALLVNGALGMSLSSNMKPPNEKVIHRIVYVCTTVFAVYCAWALMPTNPWLVCNTLVLCMLLVVYLLHRICIVYLTYPASYRFTEQQSTCACIALAALLVPAVWYAPWIVILLYGVVIYQHHQLVWYSRRVQISLSHDQHADIWSRQFSRPHLLARTWRDMQQYAMQYGDISPDALGRVMNLLNASQLFVYFEQVSQRESHTLLLTQIVQERLCALEPRASVAFGLHGADKKEAIRFIKAFYNKPAAPLETFDLPDIQT